ncbi:MAG TPA: nuclear transport factor 2 family protein [Puia sp.]|nr:nuclear transport factor 2 family protein [Puia sp.]
MKNTVLIILLFLSSVAVSAQTKDIEAIKKINADWLSSLLTKDTATLKNIFADDIILINAQGITLKKKDILDIIMQPSRGYKSATIDSIISAKVTGNIGIVIAKTTIVRILAQQESRLKTSVMNVFEKRNGKWLVIASHNTLLEAK